MTQRQPASEFRYWAFISYSHRDKSWGRWLHRALETYRVPKRLVGTPTAAGRVPARLSPIFRDRDELPTASDLGSAIEEALRQSWCLIVICSPDSAQSRWVNEEVLAFQRLGRGDRIHCLIVDSGNDAAAPLVFPSALGSRLGSDGGRIGEPVAADARRFGDGRSTAKLKLIAGILGVGYDTLVQREHQRRHRNLFYVTCASLALVIVLAVATLIAVTSRRDAVDQRTHAESLVEFMIGDLRKKLEPDGKLATLDAVGKEALAYYAAQKPESLDAEALARRARALHMIGEVYDLRGELDDALKVFEQAADSTAELLSREPDNGQRIFDHAQSVYWVGYIAYQRGNAAVAEPALQEYKQLAERLVAIDPENDDWQAELGYATSNLGTLLLQSGRVADAIVLFHNHLGVAALLSSRNPGDLARKIQLAQAHAWLSSASFANGSLREASSEREKEIAIYAEALATHPKDMEIRRAMSVAECAQAMQALSMGKVSTAVEQLRRTAGHIGELSQSEPENTEYLEANLLVQTSLGEALGVAGDDKEAGSAISTALEIATQLVAKDASVIKWQLQYADVQQQLAIHLASAGDHAAALRMAQEMVERVENVERLQSTSRSSQTLAKAWSLVGEQYRAQGNDDRARDAWTKTISILAPDGADANDDPASLAVLAMALKCVGRQDEAAQIVARLQNMGYSRPDYVAMVRDTGAQSNGKRESGSSTQPTKKQL